MRIRLPEGLARIGRVQLTMAGAAAVSGGAAMVSIFSLAILAVYWAQ